jgi:hypothetical protein
MISTAAPSRFLVGMAVLTLLTDAAAGQPLLVAADERSGSTTQARSSMAR